MRLKLTLPVLFLLGQGALAQITIEDDDMPHSTDALFRTRAFLNPFVDYATTGANEIWDFSDLQANTQDSAIYQTVASTNFLYALAYADIFFNPNRANHALPGSDIPFSALLPIDNPYTFFYRTSSQYKKVGYGAEVAGIPIPITYQDHDVIYELPLDFGDVSADYSAWDIQVPGIGTYGYSQDRDNDVDGWGTLTTPAGSFDVLRVHTTLAGRDTIGIDSLGFGFAIERPTVHEYKWLADGYRMPVLQINTTEVFGFQVVTDIWFYDEPRSIVVVPPIPALCPGSTVDIDFEALGVYNTGGFLIPANEFTVQLSDASGDFTGATDIGTITGTTSGTITVTIPLGTPFGTGYRIRVVSSSPAFTGADNGFDLTIGGVPNAAASAGGATEFCAGGSVTLNGSGGGDYQWQLDGTDIPGATDPDLVADASGDYAVIVTTGCGSDTSSAITVLVYDLPETVLDDDSASICAGTTVTITGIDLSGQSPLDYQWYLDGTALAGETASTITTDVAGVYTLEVTNGSTTCAFLTDAMTVTVESAPDAVINADGATSFCDGGSVTLHFTPEPGITYQWQESGTDIAGATDTLLVVDASGTYGVVATSGSGCTSNSASQDVVVNAPPAQPVITQSGDSLYASGSGSFQWYVDGVLITGATDPWLVPDSSSDYTVLLTDSLGCSSTSDPYPFISTGLAATSATHLAVMPNPTDGLVIITTSMTGQPYAITDIAGRTVREGVLLARSTEVDLFTQPAGVYLLNVRNAGSNTVTRIVKD